MARNTKDIIDAARGTDAESLLEHIMDGEDVNLRDKYGYTPLMFAAKDNSLEMIDILLEHGADLHAENKFGDTALHIAASSAQPKAVQKLIDLGSDVHHKTSYNSGIAISVIGSRRISSPSDIARAIQVLQILIDHGIDLHIVNDFDRNAMTLAESRKIKAYVDFLESCGMQRTTTFVEDEE